MIAADDGKLRYFDRNGSLADGSGYHGDDLYLFEKGAIFQYYGNTIFYTFFGTIFSMVLTVLAGYVVAQKDFSGRHIVMLIFMVTMFFSGSVTTPAGVMMLSLSLAHETAQPSCSVTSVIPALSVR